MFCPHVCIYTTCMPGACRHQKRASNPWNWIYGWLWATKWVLGIKSWSSAKATSALNCKLLSPVTVIVDGLILHIPAPPPALRINTAVGINDEKQYRGDMNSVGRIRGVVTTQGTSVFSWSFSGGEMLPVALLWGISSLAVLTPQLRLQGMSGGWWRAGTRSVAWVEIMGCVSGDYGVCNGMW